MCGIFGFCFNEKATIQSATSKQIARELYKLSESRGKEAAGFAALGDGIINVYKSPNPASKLIRTNIYKNTVEKFLELNGPIKQNGGKCLIGHSRLVTNGFEQFNDNNQPVIKSNIVGIHNGIVVNVESLWEKYKEEKRNSQIDTEVILTLMRRFYSNNNTLKTALKQTFIEIYGMASIALMFNELNNLLLATNNGSLYYLISENKECFIFASEIFILRTLIFRNSLKKYFDSEKIVQLKPWKACLVDLDNVEVDEVDLMDSSNIEEEFCTINYCSKNYEIINLSDQNVDANKIDNLQELNLYIPTELAIHFSNIEKKIETLKRCSKCLLPETFPFIEFNEHGVCNYCLNYKTIGHKGKDKLFEDIEKIRSKDGSPDCLVTFSGGRDSSYGLHFIKKELNMNPLAYSYDWGMITDLARRNQSRLCGKLGIEHILVSADIRKKRSNIKKNVLAWLKRPKLGTVTLFMAGDKQYFYYANKLAQQNDLKLIILCSNLLEITNFKNGFCGIKPSFMETHGYSLSSLSKLKLISFFGKECLLNPLFLNASIFDTLGAYLSYYFVSHDFLNIYEYIKWDEEIIESTLIDEYDWEIAYDTKSTWRIGDGTASFYNYIYYVVSGFTENDTFRSNQIREGIISRNKAMATISTENKPRFDSIKWYCKTIGIDFERTLRVINSIPTLYNRG
ncbi:MAG: hypothetical protein ACOY90_09095 [Candidatus Zhuqueibacterota bacterium]